MGNDSIPLVIGIIGFTMLIGWIFSLADTPEVTLGTVLDEYDGTYQEGTNITNAPTGEGGEMGSMFGFVLDIPILGDILSFASWIISTLIDMIVNVVVMPSYFPSFMQPFFALLFVGFIIYVYVMIAPTK